MNGWPEGRTDGGDADRATRSMPQTQQRSGGYGPPPAQARPAQGEPPLPPGLSPRRTVPAPGRSTESYSGGAPSSSSQPGNGGGGATTYRAGRSGSGGGLGSTRTKGRPNWRRRITWGALTVVTVLVATSIGTYVWADNKLDRTVDLSALPNQPALGKGTNYLIAGSDNRQNLTPQQQKELHTGSDDEGQFGNSDSMMILHIGSNGDTLLSLPRDSYVTIPAFTGSSGKHYPATTHKLNTAFSWGGGALLAQTVEYNTGIHIDHYAEIGFGGFVNLVNALGGVHMCLSQPLVDQASGADFKAGCQTFNGAQSLEFVRERHQAAQQDLSRMANQQKFLAAVAHQAATPSTVLNPFKLYPVLSAGIDTLSVDKNMNPYDLAQMFWAMKSVSGGSGHSLTVPISNANYETQTDGDTVLWDQSQSKTLFSELQNDQPVTISSNDASSVVANG
ncbi:LytR family transcriptional regulator [Streptacidiphilus sp. PB12-B1b]|uniref:LCP family protein n=1 Tax=Streptacidiphilus sp. PB12-B1b TaxID=2705012 RepID=UPI0015F8C801|nr:LCP family protein [Streptacidiphilus sp. PB12-B1b]QMU79778.1 LytR family transcriptional regulator [Streptacidiphilus sp. PB12-B1b]